MFKGVSGCRVGCKEYPEGIPFPGADEMASGRVGRTESGFLHQQLFKGKAAVYLDFVLRAALYVRRAGGILEAKWIRQNCLK